MILIKLWLIGMFIMTFVNVFRRSYKHGALGCGLVGYCGSTPADPEKLRMLLLYNQERGEDGTGWAVNFSQKISLNSLKPMRTLHL